ncbi:MAG: hypothetical protein K9K79_01835 [Desulfohalobiaceae bacterium]|nr:hypothetical protein [Desulfohalobiaceae bacterium]
MMVKEVIVLKEVSDDLNDGKAFYDQREPGIGDYFWDSLLANMTLQQTARAVVILTGRSSLKLIIFYKVGGCPGCC